MNILYFAWMREHTGCAAEEIDLPDGVSTVADLVPHLASRSDGHATALRNLKTVRVAVNRPTVHLIRRFAKAMRWPSSRL